MRRRRVCSVGGAEIYGRGFEQRRSIGGEMRTRMRISSGKQLDCGTSASCALTLRTQVDKGQRPVQPLCLSPCSGPPLVWGSVLAGSFHGLPSCDVVPLDGKEQGLDALGGLRVGFQEGVFVACMPGYRMQDAGRRSKRAKGIRIDGVYITFQ